MKLRVALMILAAFVFGTIAGNLFSAASSGFATPLYDGGYELPGEVYSGITGRAIERPSAGDHITEQQILVYKEKVVLDLQEVIFAKFTDTNSMDPVLDEGANALEVVPQSPADIGEGDIVAYTNECTDGSVIIHRVVKQGEDQLGTYYILKGDNNAKADPCKVRFDDIQSVVVAILY